MNKSYTITELAALLHVNRQRLYRYLTSNKDIEPTPETAETRTKKYSEDVKDRAAAHFAEVERLNNSKLTQNKPNDETGLITEYRRQIADLKEQRDTLNKRLDAAEQDRRALIISNAQLMKQLGEPAPDSPRSSPEDADGVSEPSKDNDTQNDTRHSHGFFWRLFH